VFDPASGVNGKWTPVGSMNAVRRFPSATVLGQGKVLVAGGIGNNLDVLSSAELFDPITGKWNSTAPLRTARVVHMAALLPSGKVLVAGGQRTNFLVSATSELFDVGLGFALSSQPQIASSTSPLNLGNPLLLAGSKFRGVSEGSGGNGSQESSSGCPIVQLRSIENGRVVFLSSTNWQTNSFRSVGVADFPVGWALATVFVNGIPGDSRMVLIVPAPTAITLTNPSRIGSGAFQFTFTNIAGARFNALAATNASLPLNDWTALGAITEIAPGRFQFIDSQAANNPQRFYRVRSP
jgi:large repetitive protein